LELAKDLAQFAIDGGTLIIGISERDDTLKLEPVELKGLKERIEQVAQSRVDPPLFVQVREIRSSDPQKGYLVVVVPPSAMAPHMVNGRYWARGSATKYIMPDVEVWRHHERRQPVKEDLYALLEKEIERDPVPDGKFGHLFLVATPHPEREGLLTELVTGDGWQGRLVELAWNVYASSSRG
jgi:predicted HTH transcriptional regulator